MTHRVWRALMVAVAAALLLALGTARAEPARALTSGLRYFWKMDEVSGARMDSLAALNLSPNGSVSVVTGKHVNAALVAGGSSLDAVDTPYLSAGSNSFTIAGWTYFSPLAAAHTILYKQGEYTLEVIGGQYRFSLYNPSTALAGQVVSTAAAPAVNTWQFIAVWRDAPNAQIGIMVNAVINTASTTSAAADTTNPLRFGSFAANSIAYDSFGVWDRALSAAELNSLYSGGSGCDYPLTRCTESTPTLTPTLTLTPTAPGVSVTPTLTRTPTVTLTPTQTATPNGLDIYELDNEQSAAKQIVIDEQQERTFYALNGVKDVDWAYVTLKPGVWRIAARTGSGSSHDPRLTLYRNGAAIASGDDDEGKNAVVEVAIQQMGLYYIQVDNIGADSPDTRYTLSIESVPPTKTPSPSPTQATKTPAPTSGTATLSAGNGSSGGSSPTLAQPMMTPTAAPNRVTVRVFTDKNRDGAMNEGEGASEVLVTTEAVDGTWRQHALTVAGSAVIVLPPGYGGEVVVTVPYLHRLARFAPGGSDSQADIILEEPDIPVYLP